MKQLHILLVFLSLVVHAISASNAGIRALLTHVDAGRDFAKLELVHRMAHRTKVRAARRLLSYSDHPVVTAVRRGQSSSIMTNEYLVHFAIGTPPQPVALTLDTGSDLVWTQCDLCFDCFDQGLPFFNPSDSSTYAALPCTSPLCRTLPFTSCGGRSWGEQSCVYVYYYGDESLTVGQLATDSFTFSPGTTRSVSVPRLTFGCGHFNKGIFQANETGIAGFGLGRWSLPSQLNLSNFSYCFTSMFESKSSLVMLGTPASLYSNGNSDSIQTTPIMANPSQPALYFLSLKGITVGSKRLPIPESKFKLSANGTVGGTIIDSGVTITTLTKAVYELVKAEFMSQVRLPVSNVEGSVLDLCFTLPSTAYWMPAPAVPKLIFHFEGADLDLPRENYMLEDYGARLMCLVLDGSPGEQTIIGNFQQQNMRILYDLENKKLSFAPARCDKLVTPM